MEGRESVIQRPRGATRESVIEKATWSDGRRQCIIWGGTHNRRRDRCTGKMNGAQGDTRVDTTERGGIGNVAKYIYCSTTEL